MRKIKAMGFDDDYDDLPSVAKDAKGRKDRWLCLSESCF